MLLNLLFSFELGAGAADVPTITIGSASGNIGDRVVVPVTVENNPGIVSIYLDITYDSSKIALVETSDTKLFSGGLFSDSYQRNPYALSWELPLKADNITNGVIATLTFEILEGCESETIELSSPRGIINYDMDFVQFNFVSGTIALSSASVPVDGITLSETQADMTVGETLALNADVSPSDAENKVLDWSSSDTTVATVSSSGVVTAVGSGTATITAAATDGSGITATCSVTVAPVEAKTVFTLEQVYGRPGETVKVLLSCDSSENINAIELKNLEYDKNVLTFLGFTDYGSLIIDSQTPDGAADDQSQAITLLYGQADKLSGTICALEFKINEVKEETVEAGVSSEISMTPSVKLDSTEISSRVDAGEVIVPRLGDINCDGNVDIEDAVLLLQYSILPWYYPIQYQGNIDFSQDGNIDITDAVMLLQYSILPWYYPLDEEIF